MQVQGKLLAVAVVASVFLTCANAQSELSCYDGDCDGSTTDGVCQAKLAKQTTAAPSSHDTAANPLVCAEAKFSCSDALPSTFADVCTPTEKADGAEKKAYKGMYQDDCNILQADASMTGVRCCTEPDCNTPSGNPDAGNPTTLFCYLGYCLENDSDAECTAKLQKTIIVADEAHDVKTNPLTCGAFFFVCSAKYDQDGACTAPERANAVVKRHFFPAYSTECQSYKDDAQSFINTLCCEADICNEPGSVLPGTGSSLLPSSLLVLAGVVGASLWGTRSPP